MVDRESLDEIKRVLDNRDYYETMAEVRNITVHAVLEDGWDIEFHLDEVDRDTGEPPQVLFVGRVVGEDDVMAEVDTDILHDLPYLSSADCRVWRESDHDIEKDGLIHSGKVESLEVQSDV